MTALQLGAAPESEHTFTVINLETVRMVQSKDIHLRVNEFVTLNRDYVTSNYGSWLINTDGLPYYDVFISHRWHLDDDIVIDELYDKILEYTVGDEKRAVQVFVDKVRLKKGQEIQRTFGKAIVNSTVFVPILCPSALQRMLCHDPSEEDNVLIEWMLALECMSDQAHSMIRGIYPFVFGERKEDGTVGNLFAEGVIDRLPEIEPTESIKAVRKLLGNNTSFSPNYTVRSTVAAIKRYNGFICWEQPPDTHYLQASREIVELIKSSKRVETVIDTLHEA